MVDRVDELIISALSQNSKQDVFEIWDYLKGFNYDLAEEEIESRITKLEEDEIIKGYTIKVDVKKIPHRVVRVDLVTFRTSQALPKRLVGLKKYLNDAPFVLFSGRTRGGYDWITVKSFLSNEMADEENDIYRNLFGDIIQTYEVYDFVPQTEASIYALTYTEDEYKKFLKEWAPPFIGS
ncbi:MULTISPECIES: histidine kinase [Nitrosopumilus]|uniref:GAF sensor protein n=1 Tax=Nitrosopumilus piranensis TaxID=1582439 RepID=A0A0C5C014_9ARCH|nr:MULTISPECIES: histidine kinase [Nitrosopumilus]AJM92595.1 GAF sensor protein [Nitrosopumilus piranensis]KAF6244474.1 histidine kinase [Nitrosopumilus sp. b2]